MTPKIHKFQKVTIDYEGHHQRKHSNNYNSSNGYLSNRNKSLHRRQIPAQFLGKQLKKKLFY